MKFFVKGLFVAIFLMVTSLPSHAVTYYCYGGGGSAFCWGDSLGNIFNPPLVFSSIPVP